MIHIWILGRREALNQLAMEKKTCRVDVLTDVGGGICIPGMCIGKEFLMYRAPNRMRR